MSSRPDTGSSVARSTSMMSGLILLSRATGFLRTWAMAFALGNTVLAASYSLANNVPNMIYELVAGGVLSTAFLPVYLSQKTSRSPEEANAYASNLLSLVIVVLGAVSVLACIFAPQVIATQSLFSSSSAETVAGAVWLFRIFAFQMLFYGLSAVFGGLLNASRAYFWPAISSVFMNLVIIVMFFGYPLVADYASAAYDSAAYDLSGHASPLALAWLGVGTTLAVAVMALVQVPALRKAGFHFRFGIRLADPALRETMRLALPAIATTAINLVSLSVANSVALHVADNGPASVAYAKMWYLFPYGVLGVALQTAMFTEMSESLARGDRAAFKREVTGGLEKTWLLIVPMAALVFACATELIGLYAAGSFTSSDVAPIASLLRAWCVALPLYAGYMYLYRAFSSLRALHVVAWANLALTVVQVAVYVLAAGVAGPLSSVGEGTGAGLVALAIGDGVFYLLMIVVLLAVLGRRVGSLGLAGVFGPALRVTVASIAGGAVAALVEHAMAQFLDVTAIGGAFVTLVVAGIVGLVAILLFCRIAGVREVENAIRTVARKLRRR